MISETELKTDSNEPTGKPAEFAILTESDLFFEAGKKDEMLGDLQIRLGKTKEQLRLLIASL
jgi:hypothetical protein